jgi:hypothetical protein
MAFVGSERQRKWARLSQMTWGEVRTRVGQEVSKRLDLALHRAGLPSTGSRLRPLPADRPKFFFGPIKDGAAHHAALLRTHLHPEADAVLREADDICLHQFRLLGYEHLDYGAIIDWHSDPVHGKRSPLRPWFQVNFLDLHLVGDHKIIWELNRHQHLVTLAKAWLLTGNRAYAAEIAAQFYSWQKANPYPLGINWASALEVAFRCMSWLWVRSLLAGCPDLPADFHTDLLLALQTHGRYIERHLSTYFSPNTHLLGEAVALFFIGTLCPEIPAADRWQKLGWSIVLEESERQIRPDGVYFEQTLYYHVYALDFFLHARVLASKNSLGIPEQFDNALKRMLDFLHAVSEAGAPEGFGDDDGGRVFNPRRNRVQHMTDPLALGAILYDSDKYAAGGLTEEAIWLFGDKAISRFEKPHTLETASSKAFEAGGIYFMNDSQPCPQQLMIDAGPQGTGNSGHGHADALSLRFSVDGCRFLIDPGSLCYISDADDRNRFRSTAAHNTLTVDGLDQAVPEGPFAWSSLPEVKAETWLKGQTFDFFVGSHNGYRRLPDPVIHRRIVFHVKGGLWLVRDIVEGKGNHLLETSWHFAPGLEVREEEDKFFAQSQQGTKSGTSLGLLIDRKSAWTKQIVDGFVSSAYGSKEVAPVVQMRAKVKLPEDCGVLLLPMAKSSNAGTFASLEESSASSVRGYRYQVMQSAEFIFLAPGSGSWACGDCASDAKLLYCKLEDGRFTHVIMVSGTFGEWRGKRFISRASFTESFEWSNRSQGDASEHATLRDFEVCDPVS